MAKSKLNAESTVAPGSEQEPEVDQGPLLRLIGYNCRRAYVTIMAHWNDRMAALELRPVEFSVLMLVAANPKMNQKRLGRALAIDPPNMATLLDRMEERGLVRRERNPNDKRSQFLVLTRGGRQLREKAEVIATALERGATARLSAAECTELVRLLQKVFL